MAASRFRPIAVFAVVVTLFALAVGDGGAQGSVATHTTASAEIFPTIYVNYTDRCTFTITNDAGQAVTQFATGTYQILVTTPTPFATVDLAGTPAFTACNGAVQFQLTGPGVDVSTTLGNGSDDSALFPVTFDPSSTYVALDNNNPSGTRTIIMTAACGGCGIVPSSFSHSASVARTPTTFAVGPPLRQLGAILSANGTATLLTPAGKRASAVGQGTTAITINDMDAKATFVIQQNGSPPIRLTPAKFIGRKTVKIMFTPGIWRYYSLPGSKEHIFVVVG